MPAKKKTANDVPAYERVKKILQKRVSSGIPMGSKTSKRKLRMTCRHRELGRNWFLIEDIESSDLWLIQGEVTGMSGCEDGLNVFPRQSPILNMLQELGIISDKEREAFFRESIRRREKENEVSVLAAVQRAAAELGYDLAKKSK
jgi:hypothetical protein